MCDAVAARAVAGSVRPALRNRADSTICQEVWRIGTEVDVNCLLGLRWVRQDVQVVEDVVVTHRESGADRSLSAAAEETTQHPSLKSGDQAKPTFGAKFFVCAFGAPNSIKSRHRSQAVDCLEFGTQRNFLIRIADAEVERQVRSDTPVVLHEGIKNFLIAVVGVAADVALAESVRAEVDAETAAVVRYW